MKLEGRKREKAMLRASFNLKSQVGLKRPRLALAHLVLDSDMRAWLMQILLGQIAMKVIRNNRAQR